MTKLEDDADYRQPLHIFRNRGFMNEIPFI